MVAPRQKMEVTSQCHAGRKAERPGNRVDAEDSNGAKNQLLERQHTFEVKARCPPQQTRGFVVDSEGEMRMRRHHVPGEHSRDSHRCSSMGM